MNLDDKETFEGMLEEGVCDVLRAAKFLGLTKEQLLVVVRTAWHADHIARRPEIYDDDI